VLEGRTDVFSENEVKESSIKPQLPQPLYQEAHRHQPLTILATPAVQSHTNMTVCGPRGTVAVADKARCLTLHVQDKE